MTIQEAIKVLENVVTFDYTEEVEAIDVVLKALAELKESKKGKWKPKKGNEYYYRKVTGGIYFTRYSDSDFDKEIAKNTPIFSTCEECERYWHFMDTVKEKSYEFSKEEWEDIKIRKNYIYYSYQRKEILVSFAGGKCLGEIYFKTEEDAQYIIDNFKEELMEYWI